MSDGNKITADHVRLALEHRYPQSEYSLFHEFRTSRGYSSHSYIDTLVLGHWLRSKGITSFEIKVDKGDFDKDISDFHNKQGDALEVSNEFYYIAPKGIVDMDRLPAGIGYMEVNKNLGTKVIRPAIKKEIKTWSWSFISSLSYRISEKEKRVSGLHNVIKFLGKDITDSDFSNYVAEKERNIIESQAKAKSREFIDNWLKENAPQHSHAAKQLDEALGSMCGWNASRDVKIKFITRLINTFSHISGNISTLRNSVESLNTLWKEMGKIESEEK